MSERCQVPSYEWLRAAFSPYKLQHADSNEEVPASIVRLVIRKASHVDVAAKGNQMSIQDLGALGEILGGAGVIITLIYLARQIRENSRQVRLSTTASLNDLINQGFDPIYNNAETTHIWLTGLESPTSLDHQQWSVFGMFMARLMNTLYTVAEARDNEVIDAATQDRYVHSFRTFLETPGGRRWLEDTGFFTLSNKMKKLLELSKAQEV